MVPESPPQLEIPTEDEVTRFIKHLPLRNSLLTIDADGVCREYSLADKNCISTHNLYDQPVSERVQFYAEVLPERNRLIVFGGRPDHGHIALFELNTMELLAAKSDLPGCVHLDFLPGDQLIVGCLESARVMILSADDLSMIGGFDLPGDGVEFVRLSPDRNECVFSTFHRGKVTHFSQLVLWDLQSNEIKKQIGIEGEPFRVVEFSPDGQLIAAGQYETGNIFVFDRRLNLLRKHPAHSMSVTDICFSVDSRRMITSGMDGAVHVWNLSRFLAADQVISRLDAKETFFNDAEFLDNDTACATCSGGLIIFNVHNGQELDRRTVAGIDGNQLSIAVSPDRTLAALTVEAFPERRETQLEIFNVQTRAMILKHRFNEGDSGAAKRAFSPDGRFYVHFINGRVTVFDVIDKNVHSVFELPATVKSVSFAPDDKSCVFATIDGILHQYAVPEFEKRNSERGDSELLIRAKYSPDGEQIAAVGFDRRLNLFHAKTLMPFESTCRFPRTAKYLVDVEFSPNGKRIATSSSDGTVRLWDVATGEELLMFRTESAYYPRITFSPNGTKMLVASGDEVFVVHAAAQGALRSLSISQLKDLACQSTVKPWQRFKTEEKTK